jgi:proteasome lid subunit RPN8/RPN11
MMITEPDAKSFINTGPSSGYIIVPVIIRKHLEEALENSFPDEGCGFLLGVEKEGYRIIKKIWPVRNAKPGDQTRRFLIDPRDYLKAEQLAAVLKMELLGIYHSHPNHPAKPSIHDFKNAVPYFSFIILSVYNGKTVDWTSWRLHDDGSEFLSEKVIL